LASTNPEMLAVDEVEENLLETIKAPALAEYGISIIDVGFNRLSLPKANVSAVLKQMRAERKQFAAKYLAEGDELAAAIRSETDLAVAELESEAIEKAAKIEGDSEAKAAEIYGSAHGQDPDLYRFLRSLESLDTVLGPRSQVILRTDSEPFELLVQP
jgi:membrane protease subunit HflC